METSTPLITPNKSKAPPTRASLGGRTFEMTPLRNNRPSVAFQLDESNDDVERADRRRSVALRRSVSLLPTIAGSAGLNESGVALSEDDIKTHLQICTKLHAENKINIKNAWSLKIIDVLKYLVTKNNPDILKIAGNSLEIAGKVYGLRVDDLHAEGLKLAGSLARNFDKRPREEDEEVENIDPNAPQENQKKKQKKRRPLLSGVKKITVNHDPKSWKAPLPKLESATFSAKTDPTVSAVGNLFTNKVRMDPAGYKFMFLSKEKGWNWTPGTDPSVKPETNTKFPVKVKPLDDFTLCPPFKDFKLDEWDPDVENQELAKRAVYSQILDDVVCDNDGIPIPELDGSVHDIFQDRDIEDLNDDDHNMQEEVVPHVRQNVEHIVDFTPTAQGLALERSEYSYNSLISTSSGKINQIWAGPSHWKLKFIRRTRSVYTGQDEQKEQDKNKKRGQRKKNEPRIIRMADLKPPIDFSLYQNKKQPKKKNHVVDESKITLPLLDPSCARLFENIRELMTVPTMRPVTKVHREVEYQVDGYRYDNPNDSRYIPQDMGNDDDGADLADDHFNNGDNDNGDGPSLSQETGPAGPLTLIDAPQMVPQSYVHYATRAKKMDMKKLEKAVWYTLTGTSEPDLDAKVIPTTFSQMYKELPKHITEKMVLELSSPMALVALLHACNEKNLYLKRGVDNADFDIFGPVE